MDTPAQVPLSRSGSETHQDPGKPPRPQPREEMIERGGEGLVSVETPTGVRMGIGVRKAPPPPLLDVKGSPDDEPPSPVTTPLPSPSNSPRSSEAISPQERGSLSAPQKASELRSLLKLPKHTTPVRFVSWASDGNHLAISGNFATCVYGMAPARLLERDDEALPPSPLFTPHGRHDSTSSTLSSASYLPGDLASCSSPPLGAQSPGGALNGSGIGGGGGLTSKHRRHMVGLAKCHEGRTVSSCSYLQFAPNNAPYLAVDLCRHVGLLDISREGKTSLFALTGHQLPVCGVSFKGTGDFLVSGSSDRSIFLWSAQRRKCVLRMPDHHLSYVACVAWQPAQGEYIASGGGDCCVSILDANSSRSLSKLSTHHSGVTSIAWSPSGGVLASTAMDRTLALVDARSMRVFRNLALPSPLLNVCWSHDGQYIAASCKQSVYVWSFPSLSLFSVFPQHTFANTLSWSKCSSHLAAVDHNCTPIVLDTVRGAFHHAPKSQDPRPPAPITSVQWNPVCPILAVGSFDRAVRFWSPT
eukprot:gnl/Trimastix_PCT/4939.p1 GENE.gnl/Trimastix_PCT/4939~~gnl/Trimastix_PCT/4939.p1  ORF type:complete len:557 (+),score=16.83 gnl/Trimastix_PCT/4939:89-1672(+)